MRRWMESECDMALEEEEANVKAVFCVVNKRKHQLAMVMPISECGR